MTDRYEKIRKALAMEPTPGPWAVNPAMAQVDAMPSTLPVCKLLWPTTKRTEAETWANGQLIAACDHDTIRALLDERDALAANQTKPGVCGQLGEAGMTSEEIIELARAQGLPETETEGVFRVNADDLGRLIQAASHCAQAIRLRGRT